MQSLTEMGFVSPSPIQAETLPILLSGDTDFLGLAATGTGKTAAFGIPLIEKIDTQSRELQALVLCPTRELVVQTAGQLNLLGKHKGVKALPIYGGSSYGDQIKGLRKGASIVVGTPGRLVDHLERGTLDLSNLQTIVLDEADEMISMGFKEDLTTLLAASTEGMCKTWLFSATMEGEVRKVADQYLREPQLVQVNRKEMLSGTVEQIFYITHESNKPEILCKLIDAAEDVYGLIFCQTKALVTDLTRYMNDRGYKVDCLHGDMDQTARERTMKAFREKKVRLLVCTDVASRGLDVNDISHVFNYSIPRELDNYVHRIGRTGRIGKAGVAMSLVTPSHRPLVSRIERMTRSRMREGKIPSRKEIAQKKVSQILARFQEQASFARAVELMDDSWKEAIAGMSNEEIAGRFLALSFPELFAEREQAQAVRELRTPSLGADGGAGAETRERRDRRDDRREDRREERGYGRGYGRGDRRDDRGERGFGRENRGERPARGFSRDDRKEGQGGPRFVRGDRREERGAERGAPQVRVGWNSPKAPVAKGGWNKPLRSARTEIRS